jgi:integrase/recombinase XerC/integrase/recombinase XerD
MATEPTSAKTQTQYWLKPEQIDSMRSATVENSAGYLAPRNDAILAVLADTGLRVNECRLLDVDMLDLDDGVINLPASIQKDYPNENSPEDTAIGLADETVRTLRMYLQSRWKDTEALFPSRQNDRISNQSIRDLVANAAQSAEIRPYSAGNGRGQPGDVHPHTYRHSVAYRMLRREEKTIYDVKARLRHASLITTDRIYSHLDVV